MVEVGGNIDLVQENKPAVPVSPVNIITGEIGIANGIPTEQRLAVVQCYFKVFRSSGREVNKAFDDYAGIRI